MHYFFLEGKSLAFGEEVALASRDLNYAYKVLRLGSGDKLVVADGFGLAREGEVAIATSSEVLVKLGSKLPSSESPLNITLLQSLTKGDKMDLIVRQAVELGVNRIITFKSERSIPHRNQKQDQKKVERWCSIIRSAAAQCRRALLPTVESVSTFNDATSLVGDALALVPWEKEKSVSLANYLKQPCPFGKAVFLFIGPEGGFENLEIEALQEAGAEAVHLGPRVLRTETAAATTVALVQSAWGDLSGEGVNN